LEGIAEKNSVLHNLPKKDYFPILYRKETTNPQHMKAKKTKLERDVIVPN
jgi:hypothetical protein